MNFTLLSPFGFAAGLFALAGGLYLLQRLRVRHREVDVVTTLFWREAVHETRARVLVQRFRHPWAYVLILAIAALLWSAFAAPVHSSSPEHRYVFLLENSGAMGHAGRFDEAKARLLELVEEAPRGAREVIACGSRLETLLLPGEETLLLEARLEGLQPESSTSSIGAALEAIATRAEVPTMVLTFGGTPLDAVHIPLTPDRLSVVRVFTSPAETRHALNSGITALGASMPQSGAWGTVDLLIEVSTNQAAAISPSVTLNGAPLAQELVRSEVAQGATRYLAHDVPARGGRIEARLAGGDSLDFDDSAALELPNWPFLRVQLSPSLTGALRVALESDPAVVLVESDADIAVRRADENLGAGLPTIIFAPAAQQQESFLVQYVAEREASVVLAELVGELALTEIDATSLAEAAGEAISIGAKRGAVREVAVWEELLGDGFNFADSRAFPLFIGGSLRWLAESETLQPWVAAGETRIATAELRLEGGETLRPLGVRALVPIAGNYTLATGKAVAASLLSPLATKAQFTSGTLEPLKEVGASETDFVAWILILAALLLAFEWRQVRTGAMP